MDAGDLGACINGCLNLKITCPKIKMVRAVKSVPFVDHLEHSASPDGYCRCTIDDDETSLLEIRTAPILEISSNG